MNNETILITGGTGSFGQKFVKSALARKNVSKIIVFSRDEMKHWHMKNAFNDDDRLRFFLGDVRDKDRLSRALVNVDTVVHAAATKIVPIAEYNPFECVKTNIVGAMNVIDTCIDRGVRRVVALSTDKASSPINIYGASKLVSDKLFTASNAYSGEHGTRFSVVRYGNVMGSRGSVIPYFLKELKLGKETLPITHPDMTRFMITLEQGIAMVWHALDDMHGGEIYVKKIPSMRIPDIAKTLSPSIKLQTVGVRPGEKIHEEMISAEDARSTYEFKDYFKIMPVIYSWQAQSKSHLGGRAVHEGFTYTSNNNSEWMSKEELMKWVEENRIYLEN